MTLSCHIFEYMHKSQVKSAMSFISQVHFSELTSHDNDSFSGCVNNWRVV